MSDREIIFGLDFSLRHGACIATAFDGSELTAYSLLVKWSKKSSVSVGLKDEVDNFIKLGKYIWHGLATQKDFPTSGAKLYIDWDFTAGFRSSSRMLVIKTAFLAGLITNSTASLGMTPIFVPPSEIRKWLGLRARDEKDRVWEAVSEHYPFPIQTLKEAKTDSEGDELDAFSLAVYRTIPRSSY